MEEIEEEPRIQLSKAPVETLNRPLWTRSLSCFQGVPLELPFGALS